VAYWTDDAVMIMPGEPVITGKAAIRAFVEASFKTPGFRIHWVSSKPIFSADGKMAYMSGTEELTLPGPSGAPVVHQMRGVTIWRMDADGQWRCTMDISNEAPAAK
jgi:ketosteroid isomerase-like protein